MTPAILAALLVCAPLQQADWTEKAVDLWAKADFDGARKLADESEGGPRNAARIVRLFCNLEQWVQQRDAAANGAFKADYKPLYTAIQAEDVDLLDAFSVSGGAYTRKYAAGLLEGVYEKIGGLTDEAEIKRYLAAKDPKAGAAAASALARLLEPRRAIVNKGGTMSEEQQKLFVDAEMIRSLIRLLKETPGQTFKDLIPGDLRAKTGLAGPKACLVLIEAPALSHLAVEIASGNADAVAAQAKVKEAILERLKLRPASSWASGEGREPVGGYVLARCEEDTRAYLPGVQTCSICKGPLVGGDADSAVGPGRITCTKCSKSLPKDAKFCEGCGTKVPPPEPAKRTCPDCGHAAGPDAKFCGECGSKF